MKPIPPHDTKIGDWVRICHDGTMGRIGGVGPREFKVVEAYPAFLVVDAGTAFWRVLKWVKVRP